MTSDTERPALRSRRLWLGGAALLATALALTPRRPAPAADGAPIAPPDLPGDQGFMRRAFAMRQHAAAGGDQPYGAVVVRDGHIVGQAPSAVVTRGDPTAHAEIEAIRDAAQRLGRRDLAGCALYSSSRPCPMCEAAAYWAGIERMIHGEGLSNAGRPRLVPC